MAGGIYNAKNKVTEHQRFYQHAYRNHTRIWRIHPRSKYLLTPYYMLLGFCGVSVTYAMIRKALGHNTWFGKD